MILSLHTLFYLQIPQLKPNTWKITTKSHYVNKQNKGLETSAQDMEVNCVISNESFSPDEHYTPIIYCAWNLIVVQIDLK